MTWDECPADFDILEQVTILRNLEQHPAHISSMSLHHDHRSAAKFVPLFFVHEDESYLVPTEDDPISPWFTPRAYVSWEKLLIAIDQVEALGDWLEERLIAKKYPRRRLS